MIKRVVISILTLMILMGCATKKLYEPKSYTEPITSIYYSADSKKIVILTKEFHYAFDAPDNLLRAIRAENSSKLFASFDKFYVTKSNVITGAVRLLFRGFDKELVANDAFKKKDWYRYEATFSLSGVRYSSGGIEPPLIQHKLNRLYHVSVESEDVDYASAIVLTPFKVVQDVVVFGAGIVLSPLLIPLLSNMGINGG